MLSSLELQLPFVVTLPIISGWPKNLQTEVTILHKKTQIFDYLRRIQVSDLVFSFLETDSNFKLMFGMATFNALLKSPASSLSARFVFHNHLNII